MNEFRKIGPEVEFNELNELKSQAFKLLWSEEWIVDKVMGRQETDLERRDIKDYIMDRVTQRIAWADKEWLERFIDFNGFVE